jgi:hypothetical protein
VIKLLSSLVGVSAISYQDMAACRNQKHASRSSEPRQPPDIASIADDHLVEPSLVEGGEKAFGAASDC